MKVLLTNPVGPATTRVKGCFHRVSMVIYEGRSEFIAFFYIFIRPPDPWSLRPRAQRSEFGVEVGESCSEPTVLSTSAPPIDEHVQERFLVDLVVTFTQAFGAVLVGGYEAIVLLAAQPHEPVTGPLRPEQTRCHRTLSYALLGIQHGSVPAYGRPTSRQRTYSV